MTSGKLTPQGDYRDPIIQVLGRAGGSASKAAVLQGVASLMAGRFTEADLECPASRPNEENWRNRASFERADMVRDGLLRQDSPRGIWALTERGRGLYRGA